MSQSTQSPRVNHFSWGRVEVEGYDQPFGDAKLFPGGARAWDWNETGTHHDPGIQPGDVQELLDHGVTTIILSKGVHERLGVCDETLAMLAARNITAVVLQTEAAIERYNQLCAHEAVGALIHSTC
jgi:hypothetical protein